MGLVCIVALMGDPMALKPGSSDDGASLALKRLQQVYACEGKYQVIESDIQENKSLLTSSAYVASAEDLKKIEMDVNSIPLVWTKCSHFIAEIIQIMLLSMSL